MRHTHTHTLNTLPTCLSFDYMVFGGKRWGLKPLATECVYYFILWVRCFMCAVFYLVVFLFVFDQLIKIDCVQYIGERFVFICCWCRWFVAWPQRWHVRHLSLVALNFCLSLFRLNKFQMGNEIEIEIKLLITIP